MRHPHSSPRYAVAPGLRVFCAMLFTIALTACGQGSEGGGGGQGGPQSGQQPPVPVDVVSVIPHTVDVMAEYPGRVRGRRTVQVRARVEGIVEQRYFNEGEIVAQGDMLFLIDPKPFQAVVNQRKAQLSSARADLAQAQRNWARVRRLYEVDAVSEAERDSALSQLETARAAVEQAQANLDAAEIDLGYTRVEAPLTGVTSLREVDEGALVSNGTQLTTITQLDPVHVLFALPEDDAFARRKALAAMGDRSTDARTREATIILSSGEEFPVQGVVDFTQSTINPDTGTVQLRAVVQNPNNALMPGRYVRARIRLETRHNAIVVPNVAISDGQQETQVFVVTEGNKAKAVSVKLGPAVEGGRLIESGLSGGERVIVSGLGQVQPDAPVKVKEERNSDQNQDAGAGKGPGGSDRNGADEQPVGESASRESRPGDPSSALAQRPVLELRLSPREPLEQAPPAREKQSSREAFETDNAYAARVGRGS